MEGREWEGNFLRYLFLSVGLATKKAGIQEKTGVLFFLFVCFTSMTFEALGEDLFELDS